MDVVTRREGERERERAQKLLDKSIVQLPPHRLWCRITSKFLTSFSLKEVFVTRKERERVEAKKLAVYMQIAS